MSADLSVIIPAHNPTRDYLKRVMDGLRAQTLARDRWQLRVVDNCSDPPVSGWLDLNWHPDAMVICEDELGLTRARVRGVTESAGKVVVFVDDDNVLAPDYLDQVLCIATNFPFIGTWAGAVEPEFERPDLAPPPELYALLTLRDVPVDLWSNDPDHHASTPWGAGLCVRREVAEAYVREVAENPSRSSLDLQGSRLIYSGDTDIAYTGCRMGYAKGVFSRLRVTHLISAARCSRAYLCRVAQGRGYTEVLHAYVLLGALPASERIGLSQALRYIRMMLKPGISRATAFAHLKGRRLAFRELTASNACQ